jgi:hypothetical protein
MSCLPLRTLVEYGHQREGPWDLDNYFHSLIHVLCDDNSYHTQLTSDHENRQQSLVRIKIVMGCIVCLFKGDCTTQYIGGDLLWWDQEVFERA